MRTTSQVTPSPCLGGPILLPRENKNHKQGASRFDIKPLASPHYHGKQDGVATLHPGFSEKCGYNMISCEDVVMCFNNIIFAHRWIMTTWNNPVANTYGPQVDCILLKLFKLFLILDSTIAEDAVHFYYCFQELTTSHLIALMPFNAFVLKN
jgi:hypothetical protein